MGPAASAGQDMHRLARRPVRRRGAARRLSAGARGARFDASGDAEGVSRLSATCSYRMADCEQPRRARRRRAAGRGDQPVRSRRRLAPRLHDQPVLRLQPRRARARLGAGTLRAGLGSVDASVRPGGVLALHLLHRRLGQPVLHLLHVSRDLRDAAVGCPRRGVDGGRELRRVRRHGPVRVAGPPPASVSPPTRLSSAACISRSPRPSSRISGLTSIAFSARSAGSSAGPAGCRESRGSWSARSSPSARRCSRPRGCSSSGRSLTRARSTLPGGRAAT